MLVCDHLLKMWKMGGGEESVGVRARSGEEIYTEEPFRAYVVRGNSASSLMRTSILFNQAARRYGRRDLIEPAQRMIDFVLGANPQDGCYVNGAGYNHFATNVFGQFFPSTPAIPGGFAHKLAGEYDMPRRAWRYGRSPRRRGDGETAPGTGPSVYIQYMTSRSPPVRCCDKMQAVPHQGDT